MKKDASDERRANLCGAILIDVNLAKAYLHSANLTEANLSDANLTETDLRGANLAKANLHNANLTGANLMGTNLTGATLFYANLTGATLFYANLTGATLGRTNLTDANLMGTNLTGADLFDANLAKANLRGANLAKANLAKANLAKADLTDANFQEAFFQPVSESLPVVSSAARAKGWSEIIFDSPFAAVELREAFKKAGLREQQRQLTRAINYRQTHPRQISFAEKKRSIGERLEAGFRWLLFEKTCEYGWLPGRPLRILGGFLLLFAIFYRFALSAKGPAGIWAIWSPDRVHKSEGQDKPVRVTDDFGFSRFAGTRWEGPIRQLRSLWVALYFSLLSAFHLGWRELNVGTWISRIQPREYTLRATGWVRVVAGIQSLLSVYLVALWALTYFGSPFE